MKTVDDQELSSWGNSIPDSDETDRAQVLASYPLELPEVNEQLDRIAALAARICDTPVALASFVESERQVFRGRAGTDLSQTPRDYSFCAHAMHGADCMVVPDATADDRFRTNPLVTGAPAIRFYAGQPLRSPEGAPLGALCVIDVNPRPGLSEDQRRGLETLALSAMALIEKGRVEARHQTMEHSSRREIDHMAQRFHVLADAMPQLVWSADDLGMVDYFNHGWCEFTGLPPEPSLGTGWTEFLHPEDRSPTQDIWGEAVRRGQSYETEYRLRNAEGDYRWMLARGEPMRDRDGRITRWIGTCTDIDEQKSTEEQLQLLSRELNHRIKNIFAVISGLISLSIRRAPALAVPAGALQERVLALGRAHDFVRTHSGPDHAPHPHSSLMGMLETMLAPYQDSQSPRIVLSGEDIAIDDRSATPLALFFHEMATNAAKYGALADRDGSVEIAVSRQGAEGAEVVVLDWRETGGSTVAGSPQGGFGASLMDMSVTRQLGGKLDFDWRPEGLHAVARIPAPAMMR